MVTEVIQQDVPLYSEWVGTTEGFVNAQIHPKVSGYLLKQNYKDGDQVNEGQLLFQIDDREYKAALDQALGTLAQIQAELKRHQQDLARYTTLFKAAVISKQEFDTQTQTTRATAAQVQAAQAAVESAQLNMQWTRVTSPIGGIAGIAKTQVGDLVGPTTLLTTVSQLDPIKVTFPISEREYLHFAERIKQHEEAGVAKNEPVLQMVLADGKTYKYPGHFYVANRQVNVQTGTIIIQGVFPNPDYILRPGLYAKIRVAADVERGALLVPQSAVLETQGQSQVAVVGADNRVSLRNGQDRQAGGQSQNHRGRAKARRTRRHRGFAKGLRRDGSEAAVSTRRARQRSHSRLGATIRTSRRTSGRSSRGVREPGAPGLGQGYAGLETMSKFFINRPIVAMVIAIFFVIAGAVMVFRLPVAQFPEIVPPEIQTTAVYTGADALTVEQSVATPIEEQVNGAKNMIYMQSINGDDGTMTLQANFEVGTDVDLDQVQVQNRLSQALSSLPAAVSNYGLTTQQTVGLPLLVFAITSPHRTWDQTFLANYTAINIEDELARIPGIGQVKVFGASNYAMRIWVAPDTLAKLQLTVDDIDKAISAQNVVNPAGTIGGEPAPPGQQLTYTVRAQGRLLSAEEFGNVILRANPDGSLVRLKDVARIQLGAESYNQQAYMNGAPSSLLILYQNPGSNALEAANRAKARMTELARRFPQDMQVTLTLDTTVPVTEGAWEIVKTLLEAIGLVVLVVFIFLQSWRATLIPILTIPVSLVGAFMFFPAVGFSVNTLSLLGLVLAVGLVVDDAIVVVEAITAKIEQGRSPRDAAIEAMDEVGGALVGIALVLSAVFIPTAFMAGITGSLYRQFALTIAFSVIISAFNALTLSPALGALLLRPKSAGRRAGGRSRGSSRSSTRGSSWATRGYVSVSGLLIRKFVLALAITGRVHDSGGRDREDPAPIVPAGRGPGLFHNQRRAAGSRLAATDDRGDAEDRRDPEA